VDRARALQERARLRASANDIAGAEVDLAAASTTFKTYELPIDEFGAWVSRAQLMHRRGAVTEAFAAIDQALALAEAIRLQSANPELRSTLLQPLRPAFDLKIAMLSEQYIAANGNAQEQELLAMRALETAEQARARALADYQTLDVTAPAWTRRCWNAVRRFTESWRRTVSGSKHAWIGQERQTARARRSTPRSPRCGRRRIRSTPRSARLPDRADPPPAKSTSLHLSNIPDGVAVIEYWLGTQDRLPG